MADLYITIVREGTFYYPATKHYDGKGPVACDFCFVEGIDSCISYEDYDLCLSCVNEIVKQSQNSINTRPINFNG